MSGYCHECHKLTEECDLLSANNNKLTERVEALEAALRETQTRLLAQIEPWCGVRADILPPYIVSLAPLLNDLHRWLGSESETPASTMDYGGVGQVGCEREDGTLTVHGANETCEVCQDSPMTDPGDLIPYDALPLGARFRYPGGKDVWVKLENGGCGVIAQWEGLKLSWVGQAICSFEESEQKRQSGLAESAEGSQAVPRRGDQNGERTQRCACRA